MTIDDPPGRDRRESDSRLRHDLVTPINQILGFADLLIVDAESQGRTYRALSLRSIRGLGLQTLEAIDRALSRDPDHGRPADLASMASGVVGPSDAIVEACRALEEASTQVPDRSSFLEDLAKIRSAASQLAELARRSAGAIGDR